MRVKYLSVKYHDKFHLEDCPSFSATGSIKGMKKLYYGDNAMLVKCGSYIYNIKNHPQKDTIYYNYAR